MSIDLPFSDITDEIKEYLTEKASIKPDPSTYDPTPKEVSCINIDEENEIVSVPMYLAQEIGLQLPPLSKFSSRTYGHQITPLTIETDPKGYRDQDVIIKDAIAFLKETGVCFLALSTGTGKTLISVYIFTQLKVKTCVLCFFNQVNLQWKEEFETKTDAKVQFVTVKKAFVKGKKTFLDPSADVYIIGIEKANNIPDEEFADIGLVIYDEAHIATKSACCISNEKNATLLKFKPRYLIGLSATPDRADGMEKVMEPYFGPTEGDSSVYIFRRETKPFIVYKVPTPFEPEVKHTIFRGKKTLDWTFMKKSIEYNEDRWSFIVEKIMQAPEIHLEGNGKIIVISWSIKQSEAIADMLIENGVRVAKLYGTDINMYPGLSKKERDAKKKEDLYLAKVIVAGLKKAAVGFNDPALTSAYIISDIGDVRQAEGRLRSKNVTIYDFVDKFRLLETHWYARLEWYKNKGATIKIQK